MSYLAIDDFRFGMDRRRNRMAGTPGTLWTGKNVHITRGGDIERRQPFVSAYTLPVGTFSAYGLRGQLYVFGSADLAATVPVGVQYQRLQAPDGAAMSNLLDVKSFDGLIYAIAEYVDGDVYHFYNGARVTDWDNAVTPSAARVAEVLGDKLAASDAVSPLVYGTAITLTARTAGTAFTCTGSATDGGGDATQDLTVTTVQANVAAVAEVLATATIEVTGGSSSPGINRFTSLIIGLVELLAEPVDWVTSDAVTATRLAAAINNNSSTSEFTAAVLNETVTISALAGTGATLNGNAVSVVGEGDIAFTASGSLTGGVTAVEAVAQVSKIVVSGTIDKADTFTVTLDGTDYKITGLGAEMGRSASVHQHRVWSPCGSLWRYCMLDEPTVWDPANATPDNDAGNLNVASESEGNANLVGAGRYQNLAAVFSEDQIVTWHLDTDPTQFAIDQTLDNIGTISPQSILRYGNNDTFFLDQTGIRSLRARDASNAPFASDVGNAIDTFVQEHIATVTREQLIAAVAGIEPRDGRYWLAVGGRVFVLSYFPGSKISAWTYYEPEEFDGYDVQAFVRTGKRMFVRAGDTIFVYGGMDGGTYPEADEVEGEVQLPFLAARAAGTLKEFGVFDLGCVNSWAIDVAYDPNDDTRTVEFGTIEKATFNEMNSTMPKAGPGSMVALNLTCTRGGPASISLANLHFKPQKGDK